jgi:FMN phosphatase YigB (HAD superfamily)
VADLRPIIVSDFDGTVYRSNDPIRFYARRVAGTLSAAEATRFLDVFERYLAEGVAAADSAADPDEAVLLRGAEDGWGVVAALAAGHRIDPDVSQQAFLASRMHMLDESCSLEIVEPLVELYAKLRGEVRIVLATNSPADGLAPLLTRMGLADAFDEVVSSAAKPAGLHRWIEANLGDRPASMLFSIGDHYRNDIAPAAELGAATGYIDRFGRADGPATATGVRAEDILPAITAWAQEQSSRNAPSS